MRSYDVAARLDDVHEVVDAFGAKHGDARLSEVGDAFEEGTGSQVSAGMEDAAPLVRTFDVDAQLFLEDVDFLVSGERLCREQPRASEGGTPDHHGINAVAAEGIEFAFIRVGYRGYGEAGTLCEDSTAVSNLRAAKAADLQVGTYFFSQALNEEEARQEAALVLRVIEESGVSPDLPLMYDPELIRDDEGRANGITREQVARNTAAFRDEVESASPWTADIYANLPWEDAYFDGDTLNQYDIWYADYEPKPQTPYHFTWWQYTNEGSAPGIEGPVDLNLWIRRAPGG